MKGSMVIEASYVLPVLLGIYCMILIGSMGIYQEIRDQKINTIVEQVWEVEHFYLSKKVISSLQEKGDL